VADDLVARDAWEQGALPFVADRMQVGVAHAAISDADHHVVRARFAPRDVQRFERLVAGACAEGFGEHGMFLLE
jgi:hypothetical protein